MFHQVNTHRFAVAALAALAALAAATAWAGKDWKKLPNPDELMIEESFDLDTGARLRVDVSDVDIALSQTDGRTATVKVYARSRNQDRAREYFEDLHMKVVEDDNTVHVQTRRAMFHMSAPWKWSDRVRVRAVIVVPAGTDMRVKTDDGDIEAKSLEGRFEAQTSDGDVLADALEGEAVDLKTSDGDVKVDRIEADKVSLRTSDGDIHAGTVVAKELDLSTSDGDVVVKDVTAEESYLSTSDGNVSVGAISGRKLRARTSDGDIEVALKGNVSLDLRTSDGDIRIDAPRDLGADLHLKGEHVRLSGHVEIDGELSKSQARGRVGGGGVEIVARTSDGTVIFQQEP